MKFNTKYAFALPYSILNANNFIHAFGGYLSILNRGVAYHPISIVVDRASSALTVLKVSQSENLLNANNYMLYSTY